MITVDVAEPACFTLFRVMQTPSPVDCYVAFPAVQPGGAFHTSSSADATELKQSVKHWTVVADVVLSLLFRVIVHIVGCDFTQEVNVLVGMELRHFEPVCWLRALQ